MEKADKNEKERLRDREKDSAKALLEAHLYPKGPSDSTLISNLHKNIKLIDSENTGLKSNLLSLIHDYKLLKDLVLNKHTTTDSNVRKRSFTEVVDTPDVQLTELINDMSDLSYQSKDLSYQDLNFLPDLIETTESSVPNDFTDYITYDIDPPKKKKPIHRKFNHYKDFEKLDTVEDSDVEIDFEDDEDEESHSPTSTSSTGLSRTTSPSSDFENNSLMSTLTRSTTVSSVNTAMLYFDKKSVNPFKTNTARFFELPKFDESLNNASNRPDRHHFFSFDQSMNSPPPPSSDQDKYLMINDFLEEKLLNNDLEYYVGENSCTR